jgi:hypothetical protein
MAPHKPLVRGPHTPRIDRARNMNHSSRPKVSRFRFAMATVPRTLFALSSKTLMSRSCLPSRSTRLKYSLTHTTMFWSEVLSTSWPESANAWAPVVTACPKSLLLERVGVGQFGAPCTRSEFYWPGPSGCSGQPGPCGRGAGQGCWRPDSFPLGPCPAARGCRFRQP